MGCFCAVRTIWGSSILNGAVKKLDVFYSPSKIPVGIPAFWRRSWSVFPRLCRNYREPCGKMAAFSRQDQCGRGRSRILSEFLDIPIFSFENCRKRLKKEKESGMIKAMKNCLRISRSLFEQGGCYEKTAVGLFAFRFASDALSALCGKRRNQCQSGKYFRRGLPRM